MKIAQFKTDDGRIAEFEVDDDATPEQAQAMFEQWSAENARNERSKAMTHEVKKPFEYPDVKGGVRALTQGVTLGTSDEIGAALATGALKGKRAVEDVGISLGLKEPTERQDLGGAYQDIYGTLEEERKQFREDNPAGATALNVLGGLGTGGVTALKYLPQAGNLRHLRYPILSAEGAFAGYAGADQDKRNEGALMGGVASPVLAAGLRGGGKYIAKPVLDAISKRRYTPDMGSGENYVPLPMTNAQGIVPEFLRKSASQALGGRQMRVQSQRVLDKATQNMEQKQREISRLQKANKKAQEFQQGKIQAEADANRKIIGERQESQLKQLNTGSQNAKENISNQFRAKAALDSLPQGVDKETRELLQGLPPQDVNKALDELWQQQGFQSVKGRPFVIDKEDVTKKVMGELDNVTQREYGAEIRSFLNSAFKRDLKPHKVDPSTPYGMNPYGQPVKNPKIPTDTGDIDGDALMQIRNKLRQKASDISKEEGKGATQASAYRKAASEIDAKIRAQLGEGTPALKAFEDDLAAWGTRRNFDNATIKANTYGGLFTPEDWLRATGSKRQAGRGQSRLQDDAYQLQKQYSDLDEVEKASINKVKSEASTALAKTKSRQKQNIENLKTPANKNEIAKQERLLSAKNRAVAKLHKRLPKQEPPLWSQHFNTGAIGAPLTLLTMNPTAGHVAGGAIAKALTSQTGGKVLAGQTGIQKKIAETLRSEKVKQNVDDMITGFARERTGEI